MHMKYYQSKEQLTFRTMVITRLLETILKFSNHEKEYMFVSQPLSHKLIRNAYPRIILLNIYHIQIYSCMNSSMVL